LSYHQQKLRKERCMIRNSKPSLLLALSLLVFLSSSTVASSRKYKNAVVHADDSAWYVGTWAGSNMAFDPPLDVEMTILPGGEVYSFAHGAGLAYRVSTHGKVIKLRKLPDTPMRGKMQSASTMILEDGGVLSIDEAAGALETTSEKLGIVVRYSRVKDQQQLGEIQQRVINQVEAEAHHKDHDFWRSPEFWGAVAAGAIVGASHHEDHITIENPGITQADVENLKKYYK
jgi:hypothetical protein